MSKKQTHEEYVIKVGEKALNVEVIGVYVNNKTPILHRCKKDGYIWLARPDNILSGYGCPVCAGRVVARGINDFCTVRPDLAKLLKNPEEGYLYTQFSRKRLCFVCPDCGCEHWMCLYDISTSGFSCPDCGDGVSYPNKFGYAFFKQLPVVNLDKEWDPDWLKPYRYDFYFEYNDQKFVVEMDGGLGHGCTHWGTREEIDIIGLQRDRYKDSLATNHGIQIIRIDCNYIDIKKRFNYICNSIRNSAIGKMFDLSSINWDKCHMSGASSLIKQSASLYNDGNSVAQIGELLGHKFAVISAWLKQATEMGLCSYIPKPIKKEVNIYDESKRFVCTTSSELNASRYIGTVNSNVNYALYSETHRCKNYFVYLAIDPTQPDKTKIISTDNNAK